MAKKKDDLPTKVDDTTNALATLYDGDTSTGFEQTTSDDYSVPFLKLLQKMSPEVDPDDGAFLKEAKAGMFFDSTTGELLESVDFIPCYYRRTIVEWRTREEGGGFVAQHEPGHEQQFGRDDSGRWVTPNGTYLSDTRYFFGLRVKSGNDLIPSIISFTSTQIKKSRTWLTRMQVLKYAKNDGSMATLPIYAHIWKISSVPEENEKGSWRGYKIDLVGPIENPIIVKQAKDAHGMFQKTSARVRPVADGSAPESDVPF